ncbi:uncharacterized protein LOC116767447 [Danaus plexippus]|uniref:uncharacterized protein LOC116767447 n=1 Tax=Danaus plexippus TaxID=13037 RepID=UPI002AB2215C|nr:uncharacterized protein LOC116767447 [Danaus plexippus]
MNSQNISSSPTYKNVKIKKIHSPLELKEKMRKDYKSKIQSSRCLLLNKIRGSSGSDLRDTLTDIFNETVNSNKDITNEDFIFDVEEAKILEEIKQELIQNELDWWIEEYEKSQNDYIDWLSQEYEENIICLICQKHNFLANNDTLSCPPCNIKIKVNNTLQNLKNIINEKIEKHNSFCCNNVHFSAICESNETHIYYICDSCEDMQLVI